MHGRLEEVMEKINVRTPPPESIELVNKASGKGHCQPRKETVGPDDILNSIGCGLFQVIAYFLAALSFFAFASRNFLTFAFVNLQISQEWNLSGVEAALVPATSSFGILSGGMILGLVSDRLGRVWPYAIFAFLLGMFVLASAFSPTFYAFVILRGIVAFFMAGTQLIVHPTLLEFLPIDSRGQVGVLVLLNQSLGSTLAAVLAWYLNTRYSDGWRLYIIATSIPCMLLAVYRLVFFCESPRYLISKGKIDKAWKTFSIMAKINGKKLEDIASIEDFEVNRITKERSSTIAKLTYIFKPPHLFHTLCLLIITSAIRMFVFARTFMFLSVLLKNLDVNPYLGLVISSVAQIPGVLLMSIITEWPWFGRLNTLRLFTLLATLSYFLFAFIQNEVSIPLFTVFIFFSIAPMTSMVFTYVPESYPTEIRTTAVGLINVSTGLSGIISSFITGYLADLSKQFSWLFPVVMGSTCFILFLISLGLGREMRGKELEDSILNSEASSCCCTVPASCKYS